ncbi:MAG: M28 family peptidase [Planctomycetota bacterium]|nr:M28 family peptidase [Planctomycetota bacterium]
MKKLLLQVLGAGALVALASAVPIRTGEGAALTRGLAAVRSDFISADIYFFAADAMGGRDTPSTGLKIAANYIRARLQRIGFQPGGDEGFFAPYDLESKRLDPEESEASFTLGGETHALEYGKDYFFRSSGVANLDLSGRTVFCGKGSEKDVAELDLAGAWAVVYYSRLSRRGAADNVRERGAIGLIVTPGPDYDGRPFHERYRTWARRARTGSTRLPTGKPHVEVYPTVHLGAKKGGLLIGNAPALGQDLDAVFHERRALVGGSSRISVDNVCGLWPGADPELSKEVLIVSAHYDHVGTRGEVVYNGADDNGSGSTGLLALAEALVQYGPMRRSVLLIWVSGEEKGLLGSRAWTKNPTLPEGHRAVANINIDMIGRNAPDYLLITPTKELEQYNDLVRMAEAAAPLEGFPELGSCDEYWARSDQKSFSDNLGIPVCFVFSDVHEDYHQPTDTPDKIDTDKIRRVVRVVLRMLDGLQTDELFADASAGR